MNYIENKTFGEERALYDSHGLTLQNCAFDGAEDGESALKECTDITVEHTYCNLRYPFWHDSNIRISSSEMTELCRAALWYTDHAEITDTKMHGIKALRECSDIRIHHCDIISPEFGWSVQNLEMSDSTAQSEYFMMRSENLHFTRVQLKGKYSFQYIKNALFENCEFNTKDAFWHCAHVTVRNCTINGEYLAWYSEDLTLENCRITGTQPFCYCKGLKLIHCEMIDTDLCFEKSEVNATLCSPVISIKNPLSGTITVPHVGEIIMDDARAKGIVIQGGAEESLY